uniref:Spaetzle domain-containing protein n=1 Tax=Heterorhabditis bacteriophora TaxID=37862 RepID=A0A1I7WLX9_HETBA
MVIADQLTYNPDGYHSGYQPISVTSNQTYRPGSDENSHSSITTTMIHAPPSFVTELTKLPKTDIGKKLSLQEKNACPELLHDYDIRRRRPSSMHVVPDITKVQDEINCTQKSCIELMELEGQTQVDLILEEIAADPHVTFCNNWLLYTSNTSEDPYCINQVFTVTHCTCMPFNASCRLSEPQKMPFVTLFGAAKCEAT